MNFDLDYIPSEEEQLESVKNYEILYKKSIECIKHLFTSSDTRHGGPEPPSEEQKNLYRIEACSYLNKIVCAVDGTEYLLLDSQPRIPRNIYLESFFNLGTLLKDIAEYSVREKYNNLLKNNANRNTSDPIELSNLENAIFNKSLNCFMSILRVDFENNRAIQQIVSIYTQLTYFSQGDPEKSLNYLRQSLLFAPSNSTLHYNLGHIYKRLNNLESSIIHYNLSIHLNQSDSTLTPDEKKRLLLNCNNGIASVYRNIKQWPQSLHYLLKALELQPDDPDLNNQLGVVYTEMRRTDLGEDCYLKAIENYSKTFMSTDSKFLLAEIYLNYGSLFAYNGDNNKSIEAYNKALTICPRSALPFQNKLMNLCYIFDQLEDPMYITNQHKLINKLYAELKIGHIPFKWNKEYFKSSKINIGIVSGDFIDHPVSYFISTLLRDFDVSKFNITCYSEMIIDTDLLNKGRKSGGVTFKLIKGMGAHQAAQLIHNDNVHILLDLAGNTGHNRLDLFSLKPCPISICYIGYPFTSGLSEIDYRFTDNICDGDFTVSQKFYSEKLIALDKCFLCYDPEVLRTNSSPVPYKFKLPDIKSTPRLKNPNELIIGCFNRINKITDTVITEFNNIMIACPNVKMLFKTKALINLAIRKNFLNKFDKKVQDRIIIIDCTLSHESHVETYNSCDISIDTWPYSGTTTTCEALSMGCPVLSLYDSVTYFHAQNVSCSILKNSDLDFYVCNSTEEIIKKIKILESKPIEFWKTQKEDTRNKFLNGDVCDKFKYLKNIQKVFSELYLKHRDLSIREN
jgi:predicted O-linked N-acetylglucosamine transferase (SPINDLY family)